MSQASESELCVLCSKTVRPRQEALKCDACHRWQHRICNTGITRSFYRKMVRGEAEMEEWYCVECKELSVNYNSQNSGFFCIGSIIIKLFRI